MIQRYLFIISLLFALCCSSNIHAQKRLIKGYVRDSVTGVPIINAIISNEKTNRMVTPDQNGFFSITASQGDAIIVNAFNYNFDTITATRRLADTLQIALIRTGESLPGVTVTTTKGYSRYQYDSLRRRDEFVKDMGNPKLPAVSKADNMGAGIGINLDAFTRKRDKDKRKAYNSFDNNEKIAYTDYRFSPQLVSQITGLRNDSLVIFLRKYSPSYDWLRAHPADDEVLFYINDKMKEFTNKQ